MKGLDIVPPAQRPNVLVTHLAFDTMVGCAMLLALAALLYWHVRYWRRRQPLGSGLLRILVGVSPLGFLALEAGWFVTEVGRQPWTVYGVLPTAAAVTPVQEVSWTFLGFSILYLVLGVALVLLLRGLATGAPSPAGDPEEVPVVA